jgi:hypothetical protein
LQWISSAFAIIWLFVWLVEGDLTIDQHLLLSVAWLGVAAVNNLRWKRDAALYALQWQLAATAEAGSLDRTGVEAR